MSNRENCWEYMCCGREPGGNRAKEFGVCPAATIEDLDGYNGGHHGGRFCWAVAGTFCGGEIQGDFAEKIGSCYRCNFFQYVKLEEGSEHFTMTTPGLLFNNYPE